MPIRERPIDVGSRRARFLRSRLADDIAAARRASGLSLREVARQLGCGHDRVARAERGDPAAMSIDLVAGIAAILGLELGATLHPVGAPVRDKGHLLLLERFRLSLGPGLTWRTEVPIPLPGDRRSADGVVDGTDFEAIVEAETHLDDVQRVERDAAAKQRDIGATRLILLVAATRHNRAVIRAVPELTRRFPVSTRACLASLRRSSDPGGDALVML